MSDVEDVQGRHDDRGIQLDHVGVSDLRYPIVVLDQAQAKQNTIGRFTISVHLPSHAKGTHMSRFLEVLHERRGEVTAHTMPVIMRELCRRLGADSARLEVRFSYFVERSAPAS